MFMIVTYATGHDCDTCRYLVFWDTFFFQAAAAGEDDRRMVVAWTSESEMSGW